MNLGLRAYGRHRGVSLSSVQKAITSGRIKVDEDGKINPIAADRAWAKNTEPRVSSPPPPETAETAPVMAPPATVLTSGPKAPRTPKAAASSRVAVLVDEPSIGVERALLIKAQRERIETLNAKIRGDLVEKKIVDDAIFKSARVVRDRLQNIPHRVAYALVGLNDMNEIERILTKEIYEALMELSSTKQV